MDVPEEELNRRIDEGIRRILCQSSSFEPSQNMEELSEDLGECMSFVKKPNPPFDTGRWYQGKNYLELPAQGKATKPSSSLHLPEIPCDKVRSFLIHKEQILSPQRRVS